MEQVVLKAVSNDEHNKNQPMPSAGQKYREYDRYENEKGHYSFGQPGKRVVLNHDYQSLYTTN